MQFCFSWHHICKNCNVQNVLKNLNAVDSAYFLVLFAIQTVTMKFERLFVMQKYAKLQVLSSFSCPSYKKDNESLSETYIFVAVLKKLFFKIQVYASS